MVTFWPITVCLLCWQFLTVTVNSSSNTDDEDPRHENVCDHNITGLDRMWMVKQSTCFKLLGTNHVTQAFSCTKVAVTGAGCEILHGSDLSDVQESTFSMSKVALKFLHIFTHFSPTPNAHGHGVSVCLSPFEEQYIQVNFNENDCQVKTSTVLDKSLIVYTVVGFLLFYYAERLSTSVKFYYTGGVGIGILASLLVVTLILSRMVPKKPAFYAVLFGGWSFTAWLFRLLWHNWNLLLTKYYTYFFIYVGVTGFCSFIFCYLKGPIENPRSRNIMQWTLQLLALTLIYNGSQLRMVSLAILLVVAAIKLHSEGYTVKKISQKFAWHGRPEPRRFLTEEEYRLQAEIETKKALEELREFCHSPQCSPWRTLSRMQSPERFIRFVEGDERHVTDAEMTLHEADFSDFESDDDKAEIPGDENNGNKAEISDDESDNAIDASNGDAVVLCQKDPLISDDDSS